MTRDSANGYATPSEDTRADLTGNRRLVSLAEPVSVHAHPTGDALSSRECAQATGVLKIATATHDQELR